MPTTPGNPMRFEWRRDDSEPITMPLSGRQYQQWIMGDEPVNVPPDLVTTVPDTPVATSDGPCPGWSHPRIGDLVEVTMTDTSRYRTHIAGEQGVVTYGYYPRNYSPARCTCGNCQMYTELEVRMIEPRFNGDIVPTVDNARTTDRSFPDRIIRLVTPVRGMKVKCDNESSRHDDVHTMNTRCVRPRAQGTYYSRFELTGQLWPAFAEARRFEFESQRERNARTEEAAARVEIGRTYMICAGEYTGCEILVSERAGAIIRGHVGGYGNGMLMAFRADGIGERVMSWGFRFPPGMQRADIAYTRTQGNQDVEQVDTSWIDDHECVDECFEYGCNNFRGNTNSQVDDGEQDDEGDEYYCDNEDCPGHLRIAGRSYGRIQSYNYRPNLLFLGDGPLYLGSELELSFGHGEQGDRALRRGVDLITNKMGDHAFLKGDGSIEGCGLEMVSHPMSYDWIYANWPRDLFREIRAAGGRPHSSCGMHVHVSRAGFSDSPHAYKWIKWFFANRANVVKLARRQTDRWASFDRPSERSKAKYHAKGGFGYTSERYTAINCTNEHTFEIRVFASTLNNQKFLAALGLADASVEYARQLSTQDVIKAGGWPFAPFVDYVNGFEKYKPLQAEMSRLGIA